MTPFHGNVTFKKRCVSCGTHKEHTHFQPGKRQCNQCASLSQAIRQKQLAAWRRRNGAEAQRAWRQRNPDYDSQYYATNRRKVIARSTLNRAIRQGKLPKAATRACVQCGQPAHEYHHEDYRRPLDVEPVCRLCHKRIHAEQA